MGSSSRLADARFVATLYLMGKLLGLRSRTDPALRARLAEQDMVAQVRLQGLGLGRRFVIEGGRVSSRSGLHPSPDVTLSFRSAALANRLLRRRRDRLEFLNAARTGQMKLLGADESVERFTGALGLALSPPPAAGRQMPGGIMRFTNNTNGVRSS